MKSYILLLFPLLFSAFTMKEETCRQKKFQIDIKEESMLWNNLYTVTNESLTIHRENRVSQLTTHTVIRLNKEQAAEIEKLLQKIDWKTLQDKYVDSTAPADMYAYNFTFTLEQTVKKVYIYQYKQEEIFNVVQKINQFIIGFPADYHIAYTEAYFKNKR